jgi:hypothetical protein
MVSTSQWARADGNLEPFRDAEPIVLRGDHFPDWLRPSLRYPGSHLNLYGGSVSALSQEVAITSVDTTPPVTPAGLEGTTNGLQATLTWKAYRDDDLKGFNGYVAASPGGPYQKINGSVRPIYQPWQMSLIVSAPGTYYVTMTSVDFAGNESAMSDELTIVLGP